MGRTKVHKQKEKMILFECIQKINTELQENIDEHSQYIIVSTIELLLNYCLRFYGRQMITRNQTHKLILSQIEKILTNYFTNNETNKKLPTVKYLANEVHLSPSYLSDLLKKEGEAGRRLITKYTRYGTVILAAFQALGISIALESQPGLVLDPGLAFRLTTVVTLVSGTMFLMWLGEQITERGIGNGISIIIFSGIVAGLPSALGSTLELARTGAFSIPLVFFLFAATILVTALVVFVERGQRKITVNYAKRQIGNKLYGGQTSHLPLKLNMAGVIPPIFASSIILFPATLAGWFGSSEKMLWLKDVGAAISPGQPIYIFLFAVAIVFFCFFYTALVFNPKETADNLKKGGAFVPGIRPGEQTAKYIDQIMGRLTLVGAVYITLVCLLPEFLILKFNVPFYFGGTSLLIIVVVTMDFMTQVQSHLMSYQYEGLLKKANFKGGANALR